MAVLPLRVIKFGGSLLEADDFAQRFVTWLRTQPDARVLMLVGGGPPVEAIRQFPQAMHSDESLHWRCIDAMGLGYVVVKQELAALAKQPDGEVWQTIRQPEELDSWLGDTANKRGLVHVRSFYTRSNYQQLPLLLPLNWDTTSDSLAALLAHIAAADELTLLKSCPVASPYDWPALSQAGVVDRAFCSAIQGIPNVNIANP